MNEENSKPEGPESKNGQFATALSLPREQEQVEVLAQARGKEVEQMLALALEHEIPVLQDFALSNALRGVQPGTLIPDPVFQGLAVVLDFLVRHEQALEQQAQE